MAPRFEWRHQYDDAADEAAGQEAITPDHGLSLTQQHYTADADINVMMERMGVTNEHAIPNVPISAAIMDFSNVVDFREANDRVLAAKDYFMQLPARLRTRFENDPQKLLAFVMNQDNLEESIKLGFLSKVIDTETPPAAPPAPGGSVSTGT